MNQIHLQHIRAGMLYWNWNNMYHIGLRRSYPTSGYFQKYKTKFLSCSQNFVENKKVFSLLWSHCDKLIFSRVIETKKNGSWWSKFVLGVLFKAEIKGNYIKNRDPNRRLKFHLLLFTSCIKCKMFLFLIIGFHSFWAVFIAEQRWSSFLRNQWGRDF